MIVEASPAGAATSTPTVTFKTSTVAQARSGIVPGSDPEYYGIAVTGAAAIAADAPAASRAELNRSIANMYYALGQGKNVAVMVANKRFGYPAVDEDRLPSSDPKTPLSDRKKQSFLVGNKNFYAAHSKHLEVELSFMHWAGSRINEAFAKLSNAEGDEAAAKNDLQAKKDGLPGVKQAATEAKEEFDYFNEAVRELEGKEGVKAHELAKAREQARAARARARAARERIGEAEQNIRDAQTAVTDATQAVAAAKKEYDSVYAETINVLKGRNPDFLKAFQAGELKANEDKDFYGVVRRDDAFVGKPFEESVPGMDKFQLSDAERDQTRQAAFYSVLDDGDWKGSFEGETFTATYEHTEGGETLKREVKIHQQAGGYRTKTTDSSSLEQMAKLAVKHCAENGKDMIVLSMKLPEGTATEANVKQLLTKMIKAVYKENVAQGKEIKVIIPPEYAKQVNVHDLELSDDERAIVQPAERITAPAPASTASASSSPRPGGR